MAIEKTEGETPKVVVKAVDMSDSLQAAAIEIAQKAFEDFTVEKDIAQYIKKEFDRQYGVTWHCIVGKSFGSYVTHETGNFMYYYLGSIAILLFKSG